MKGAKIRRAVTRYFVLLIGLVTCASICAQSIPNQQCSLAVVSRLVGTGAAVCDGAVVQRMAAEGQAFEENQMGIASVLSIGPDYDQKKAVEWFQRAAQHGYAPAQVNLAVMYIHGWGTRVNDDAAQHWLRAAADQRFARAYYNLGILYSEGKGVRRDHEEAFRWFQKGAEAGDSSAQTNLGYFYDEGLGCDRNPLNAATWYRKAAEAGNPLGENNLADLYLRGEGVKQDDAAAFAWFQKAAAQGQTGARIKLGYMYAEGRGTRKDSVAAYSWISAAANAGDPRGEELLHSIEKVLTEEQIRLAREQARGLIPLEQQILNQELRALAVCDRCPAAGIENPRSERFCSDDTQNFGWLGRVLLLLRCCHEAVRTCPIFINPNDRVVEIQAKWVRRAGIGILDGNVVRIRLRIACALVCFDRFCKPAAPESAITDNVGIVVDACEERVTILDDVVIVRGFLSQPVQKSLRDACPTMIPLLETPLTLVQL